MKASVTRMMDQVMRGFLHSMGATALDPKNDANGKNARILLMLWIFLGLVLLALVAVGTFLLHFVLGPGQTR